MEVVTIVAEPGCTAEGRLDRLKALINTASRCGADAFKAQWLSDVDELVRRRHARAYGGSYAWLAFPVEWHVECGDMCRRLKMAYGCSVYLPQDVETVAPHVDFLKVAAFEAECADLLDACRQQLANHPHLELVVSLGMGARPPWDVTHWPAGLARRLKLLACTSAYPTPIFDLRISRVRDHAIYTGYSDHAEPEYTWSGALAVAAGATLLEKHFRLDDTRVDNPDYAVALNPAAFRDYCRHVRYAEAALGSANAPAKSEAEMLRYRAWRR